MAQFYFLSTYTIRILNPPIIVNEIVLVLFLKQLLELRLDYIMNMQFKMKLIIFQNVYPFIKIAFWPINTFFYG